MTVEERLLSRRRINSDTGCWEFEGARLKDGYGVADDGEKTVTAHRLAYRLWLGEIPEGRFICHHCDNPPCFNPAHLFLGDIHANVKDSVEKERHTRGEMHGQHVLAEGDVRAIRLDDRTLKAIGDDYGVSAQNIWLIKHRRAWQHVS